MSYHVIFVKLLSPLFIALCVKCAYVQPVLENIFQINQKNIKLCHSKCKDLRFCAITIRQNLVSFIVSNATVQFAHVAFLLVNMNITKKNWHLEKDGKQQSQNTQILTRTWRIILPKYETIASHITNQKANLEKNSRKLKSDVTKHGNQWNKAIDTVIQKYKPILMKLTKEPKPF